ncbi:MAG: EthD family reductase [Actinobacteria bacterium]|nr:EthD family reductase [Actinomycetota bacterium]
MIRFLVLYPRPTDLAAFERHYRDVHIPLTKKLPGLRSYKTSRSAVAIRGPEPYYLIAELEWDDMASLQRDFASPLGRETARDVDRLAELCPGIHSMVYELEAHQG